MTDPEVLREIVEHLPTPTGVVGALDHRCRFVNAALRAMGLDDGAELTALFPSADAGVLEEVEQSGLSRRLRVTGPDRRCWDLDLTPLRGGGDSVRAIMASLRPAPSESAESADQQVREVSHRVKNTLQLVSSLLTLQTLSAKEPEMRRAFQEACARIGTVTQAHQRVHGASRGTLVDFGAYMRDAGGELETNFAATGGDRRVSVRTEDALVPVDAVIPLALILHELAGNAVKYAYAPGAPGEVELSLQPLPTGGRRLMVVDHGRGLPPGFEVPRADSLGMKVARAFAGQLKGKLRAEPNEPGTRFILDLPF